ncbi:gametogenetin [Alligator sinensis]|uniref:Gametogenetin n=1 Tax=Alligator sinensis TaxID=38654 RepID=A0A3Q0H9Y9_ALLSI|nr:gametogenetin [Alligator sinensis]
MSRWPPFHVGRACTRQCHCKHQARRRLPPNVAAWLNPSANHLAEPPWVSTAILAGSLVAGTEFLMDAYEQPAGDED